jgi:hypothetical protein
MADKATPKAMGSLSNREQEILVAALSKCLKNGDIQVSQVILPYPSILYDFFLEIFFHPSVLPSLLYSRIRSAR